MSWILTLRRSIERHSFASDAALAVALAGLVLAEVLTSTGYYTASEAIYVPASLLMTLPLAWRRLAPLAVTIVVMGRSCSSRSQSGLRQLPMCSSSGG
jgi:hypothetical protein